MERPLQDLGAVTQAGPWYGHRDECADQNEEGQGQAGGRPGAGHGGRRRAEPAPESRGGRPRGVRARGVRRRAGRHPVSPARSPAAGSGW